MQTVDGAASPSNKEPVIIYKGNIEEICYNIIIQFWLLQIS